MQIFLIVALFGCLVLDIIQAREFNRRFVETELSRDKYRNKYNDLRVKYASLKSRNGGK